MLSLVIIKSDQIMKIVNCFSCGKEQAAKVDAGGGKLACTVILGGR
ncbi:MAG: hypothetical protein ACTSSH_02540 [Candidatus Heimdallarchaeota archaeon]